MKNRSRGFIPWKGATFVCFLSNVKARCGWFDSFAQPDLSTVHQIYKANMGRQTYKASCLWIISTVHLDIRQICKAWMISFLGVWAPVYICSTELPIAKPKKILCGNSCCLKYKHLKGPSNSGSVRSSAFCKHLLRCISGPQQPKGGKGRSQRVVDPKWSKLLFWT